MTGLEKHVLFKYVVYVYYNTILTFLTIPGSHMSVFSGKLSVKLMLWYENIAIFDMLS